MTVTWETVIASIRSKCESVQTAKGYVTAMNAAARASSADCASRALIRDREQTYRALVGADSALAERTRTTRITGIVAAFNLCGALSAGDSGGQARAFWDELHREHQAAASQRAKSNVVSSTQVENMVTLGQILRAARSLTHDTLVQSQDKVLLTVAALVPAKRADWGRLRVTRSPEDVQPHENGIAVRSKRVVLVLTKYKTARTYGRHEEEIEGEAADVIRASLKAHPRASLFTSPARPQGMSNDAFATYFSRTFEAHMRKHVTINLLRHIWVTQRIDPKRMTVNEIEEVARKMLHGVNTQRLYFLVGA